MFLKNVIIALAEELLFLTTATLPRALVSLSLKAEELI
jgi:hypothetical protein